MELSSINITLDQGVLTIAGERVRESNGSDGERSRAALKLRRRKFRRIDPV